MMRDRATIGVRDTTARAALRVVAALLGLVVLVLVAGRAGFEQVPAELLRQALTIFGAAFWCAYLALVAFSLLAWARLSAADLDAHRQRWWAVAGQHAANGIATLALTFTLLGISLGVGALAEHDLTPDTVRGLVRELTGEFSRAFLTTVVGLPTAALLRALLHLAALCGRPVAKETGSCAS